MEHFVQPIILSGGSGTRLWPLSRRTYPKQFLSLNGAESLLADTILRIRELDRQNSKLCTLAPQVICNEAHRFLVAEQLRLTGFEQATIVLEPFGRNTAPALTLASLLALHEETDPVLVVLPSDHLIQNPNEFKRLVIHAANLALTGKILTFGIIPRYPESGFGYLRKGPNTDDVAFELEGFIEKPTPQRAEELVQSGDYLWNSGIFVMKASKWIEAARTHCPDIVDCCDRALKKGQPDGSFFRVDPTVFEQCSSISIDHAVMEKVVGISGDASALVIPMDVGWSDLGSWSALGKLWSKDENGNVAQGDIYTKDTENSVLYAQKRFLATLGVQDLVVVETKDAVLVAHKDRGQDIQSIIEYLKQEKRSEHEYHQQIHRPWGNYESIDAGPRYQVKRLTVKPGASLSLQMHHHRAEHWIVVSGTARVTRDEETFLLGENESTYIPLGVTHRLENPGTIVLEIIEVQSGSYLGEDDIVRFKDRYNRIQPLAKTEYTESK